MNNYEPGQLWKYKTRSGEEDSELLILHVESFQFPQQVDIIHIAINNLKIINPNEPSGFSEQIEFLPFSKKSIDNSVTELVEDNVWIHPYEEGYFEWKRAFMNESGGIFDMTVKTAIKSTEQSLETVQS